MPMKLYRCLLLLGFIAGVFGLIVLIWFDKCDPARVVYGAEIAGRICRQSAGVEQFQYAAWPYLLIGTYSNTVLDQAYNVKICVDLCSSTKTSPYMQTRYESSPYLHYCIPSQEAFPFAS